MILPCNMSTPDYLAFIGPDQHVCRLLIAHLFLLDYILGSFMVSPSWEPKVPARKKVVISWAESVAEELPKEYQPCTELMRHCCQVLATRHSRYLLSP